MNNPNSLIHPNPPRIKCVGSRGAAYLTRVSGAGLWNVTVVHSISAHRSPQLILWSTQHAQRLKGEFHRWRHECVS